MSILTSTSDAAFAQDIAQGVCLVDFWAEWCGPCRMMLPRLEELQAKLGTKAKILKMNVDENTQIAGSLRIMSIPTMVLYKNGQPVEKFIGAQDATILEQAILKHFEDSADLPKAA